MVARFYWGTAITVHVCSICGGDFRGVVTFFFGVRGAEGTRSCSIFATPKNLEKLASDLLEVFTSTFHDATDTPNLSKDFLVLFRPRSSHYSAFRGKIFRSGFRTVSDFILAILCVFRWYTHSLSRPKIGVRDNSFGVSRSKIGVIFSS